MFLVNKKGQESHFARWTCDAVLVISVVEGGERGFLRKFSHVLEALHELFDCLMITVSLLVAKLWTAHIGVSVCPDMSTVRLCLTLQVAGKGSRE